LPRSHSRFYASSVYRSRTSNDSESLISFSPDTPPSRPGSSPRVRRNRATMSENKDLPDAKQSQATSLGEAQPNEPDFVTRRVLLYEVLLEEYETHCPPDEDAPASPYEPDQPVSLTDAMRNLRQPRVDDEKLGDLKARGETARRAHAVEGEYGKSDDEYNAEFIPEFLTLLTRSQQEETERIFGDDNEKLREEYRGKLEEAWEEIPESERPSGTANTYVEWALAHEIYGFIDDHRVKYRKATAHIEDAEERRRELDRRALISWLKSFEKAPAPKATTSVAAIVEEQQTECVSPTAASSFDEGVSAAPSLDESVYDTSPPDETASAASPPDEDDSVASPPDYADGGMEES
jgi:hypothetical protein